MLTLMLTLIGAAAGPALAQSSQDGETLLLEGAKALDDGNYKVASRQLTRAMRAGDLSTGQVAKALYLRGVAQRNADKPAQAISDLSSAIWLQGLTKAELAQAHMNRALAYEAVGIGERARDDRARAKSVDPNVKVAAVASGPRDPSVPSFQTEVKREEAFQSVPAFRTEVSRDDRPAAPRQTPAFRTEVRTAKKESKPLPAFRTSIIPDEERPEPAGQPAPRPAQSKPAASQWSTSIASNSASEKTDEAKNREGDSGFFTSLWDKARGRDGEEEKSVLPPSAPAPAAPATQWTQTTKVANAKPEPALSAASRITTASDGRYRVQLAALRSEDEARSTWQRLSSRHKSLLAGREPLIEKTNLGGLGVFYRIQIGPFAGKKESTQFCNALKRGGVDCFLVVR